MLGLLMDNGADIEGLSESGTPLLWAAGSANVNAVGTLLRAGANPDAQTPEGVSAMLMAGAAGAVPNAFCRSQPSLPCLHRLWLLKGLSRSCRPCRLHAAYSPSNDTSL